jgi:uncharacterized membrane protein YbaN (DUF454 family)
MTHIPDNSPATNRSLLHRGRRIGFFILGCLFVALGFIGAVLPLMPTTVFLIAAAWAFGRSSPRLERWLLNHPKFGPMLVAWRESGAIPRRGKIAACCGIAFGFVMFLVTSNPPWWLIGVVFASMLVIALWIVSRPETAPVKTASEQND